MNSHHHLSNGPPVGDGARAVAPALKCEALPFVVRVARTEAQLQQVCQLRSAAYGRYLPEFGATLAEPEASDRHKGTVILVAEDKSTGVMVGTLRIHLNTLGPLPVEGVTKLPEHMSCRPLVEVCRFSVMAGGEKLLVRLAMFKALYLYCYANQVRFMIVTARRPLNEIYKSFGCRPPAGDEEQWVPIDYTGHLEHSILAFDVLLAERLWHTMGHPCYAFMGGTYHPDIQIFSVANPVLQLEPA